MSTPDRTKLVSAWFPRTCALLAAIFAFAWSGQALATIGSCDLQYNSSSYQQGSASSQLTFSFDIVENGGVGSCPSTVTGAITPGPDSTGGASANPTSWSGAAGDTISVVITLGPNTGSTATFTVDCPVDCASGNSQLTWTAATFSTWELVPTTAQSFTVATNKNATMGVKYLVDGAGANLNTDWVVDNGGFISSPVMPDGTGLAVNSFSSSNAGVYTVTVSGECPPSAAPTNSCPPTPESFVVNVEDRILDAVQPPGGTATIPQNTSIQLKVKYHTASLVLAGESIVWRLTSEPTVGAGNFTGGSGPPAFLANTTAADGTAAATLNVTTAGTYTIQACNESDGCLSGDDKTFFTITVTPVSADVSITKTASSPTVAPGGQLSYTLTVSNAGPNPAPSVQVDDTLPAQLSFVSISAPNGWNCSTPAVGAGGSIHCDKSVLNTNGSNAITVVTKVAANASVGSSIDNTATVASSVDSNNANDSASVSVTVAASAPSLAVLKELVGTGDNDGSGSVSAGDRLDYRVTATNNGNSTLNNVVVSDDHFAATQTCATLAPAATCVLTGSYVVTASDVSAGSITNIGKATSTEVSTAASSSVITPIVNTEPVTLGVGTGDGQSAPVNTPFPQPLTVVAGGVVPSTPSGSLAKGKLQALAAPNVTIDWQVMSGSASLLHATSVTNASGIASNNATAGNVPGPVVIRASRADQPSTFVEFHLTVTEPTPKFSELPGLDENQKALAEALDQICSGGSPSGGGGGGTGLAATASTATPASDLLARCDELLAAIGTDPSGVIAALDQLFADIALVQSESSLLAAQSQFDNIKARIAALRSGTNRTGFEGLAFRNASGRLPIGLMFNSLLGQDAPAAEGSGKEIGSDFSRWGFFASGTIGRGNADKGNFTPEYDFDVDGLTVGADYRYSDKLIFGGTLGYTKQDNELAGTRGSLDTKGWSVSAYGTWYQSNSWYMDGVFSWGQNSYDVERHVHYTITTPSGTTTIDNTGHANGDGDSLTFALSVGRDFNKGGWGFGPYLRAMYTKMDFDSLTEDFDPAHPGNGLALEFDTRSVTSLTSTLGGKLTYAHSTGWGVLIPHLQLEWQHEFEDDPAEVEARFLADPLGTPFTIHGDPVDTDFFRFGVGMSFIMTHGRSGFFYYERLISRERYSQNSLALGIRLEF
jgi:outer membrane autotransporter protein/uncharacterized repeat protein (TIGR01451 family)